MTEELNEEPIIGDEELETDPDVYVMIYPHQQGIVMNIGEDRTLLLNMDDAWRIIGRLISAATMHQVGAVEDQKRSQEQQDRVRRLIESGSNVSPEQK